MTKVRRAASIWAGVVLACCACASARDRSLDLSQYVHTAWSTRGSSLKSGVRSIAQSPDGYLWLATEFGMVRFDGVRFVEWTPGGGQQLPSTNIRTVVASRDGTLWIGTQKGLASWRDGKLKEYPQLAGQNVISLLEDGEGTVWAGIFAVPRGQLCAMRREGTQCYGSDGAFGEWVWALYEDDDGHLWAGAETGLWRWKPGPPKRYPMPRPIETTQAISQAAPHSGPLAASEGIWQLVNDQMEPYPLTAPHRGLTSPVSMLRDHRGGLWIGTVQRGLFYVCQGKTTVFAQEDGLSSDRVLSIFQDREDNIWVGTPDGLDRFRAPAVFSISMKQGLSSTTVWSVLAGRDKSVWVSTLDGLNRWKDGHVTVYRSATTESARMRAVQNGISDSATAGPEVSNKIDPGLPDDRVGSLYEDERGRVWVSTPGGIARFEGERFTQVQEVPSGWVNVITGDNTGGLWISYERQGLVHWRDGKVVERIPWSKLGGNLVAASAMPDPKQGGLWLGFFEGGLAYLEDGQVRAHYGKSDGLGPGNVTSLRTDADGAIWAATQGGLSRLKDGRITTLTRANGLPCDTVHWTMETQGFVWLYTACGLLRVPRTEIDKWSADPNTVIKFTVLDSSDGVRSHALLAGYTPHVSKSPDGTLFFATLGTVSVVDPNALRINEVPPPVHIEQIMADDKTYSATNGLRLPPHVRYLTIDYTALSLVAPEKVRFRYKLEGEDKDWREVVNARQVQYTNLPPKRYRFRVLACNNSGVWNEQGASLEFVIPPMWYQTNWFYALCAATFSLLLWGLYRLRVLQLRREFNAVLEARVGERMRVARDLHDTLLQSLHGLLLRFQTVFQLLPERPIEAKERLESAIDQATAAITEGRDAVQGLRHSVVQKNDLARAISAFGQELVTTSTTRRPDFGVTVEGESRTLHPIVRDEIYRVATEALRNAVRHADGKRVEVEIHYDSARFRLRVRDDGKGIEPQVLGVEGRQGHYGIPGMRERAEVLGGKLEIWSQRDAGTELELTIPARRAYAKSWRRSWLMFRSSAKEDQSKAAGVGS